MKRFCGIDPGVRGALAFGNRNAVTVYLMPINRKREISAEHLRSILEYERPDMAIVERVHSRPHNGVKAMFSFGMGYGLVLGLLTALRVPYQLVLPRRWKMSLGIKDSIAYCRQHWPHVDLVPPRCRNPHDGIADAVCILDYGLKAYGMDNPRNIDRHF